jgi:hypothetical protein
MRWRGAELTLLDHPYNTTALNERAVEVPLALDWLTDRDGPGLEVGNVLGHYVDGPERRIVDRYEEGPGVDNVDVFDIDGSYRWVLAISTLEHVRNDPPEPVDLDAADAACAHLLSLVEPGGAMLVTVPFDQHLELDAAILRDGLGADREATLLHSALGWRAVEGRRLWRPARAHRWAGAVWVGEWEP